MESQDIQTAASRLPARVVPSMYEQGAIRDIRRWLEPDVTWFGAARSRLHEAYNAVTDQLRRVPGFEWTMENVVSGLLKLINEITQDWVPLESIYGKYRAAGHEVSGWSDICGLDLEVADTMVDGVALRYRNLSAVEGAATGYVGLAGIPTDIVALVALNLRAAGELATHYGFDTSNDSERLFALSLLDQVAKPSTKAKNVALSPVVTLTTRLARQQAFEIIEQAAVTRAITRITRSLGIHLTRAKLAQILPVTGAVIGGGYNAYYTSRVCETAAYLYRRRFLMEKYGEGVVERYETRGED